MLIQHDLRAWPVRLREAASAGEPLNPEVMARVQAAWGITVGTRFGQTETTLQIGNTPGQVVSLVPWAEALRRLPCGAHQHPKDARRREGEICLDLAQRPFSPHAAVPG